MNLLWRVSAVGLAVVAAGSACRDAAEPFQPIDRGPIIDESRIRLTYGFGDERVPTWSANGDSIYFVASSWEENPLAPRTVLSLAADGMGAATPLLHNVQAGTGRANWIDAPALSRDGEHIAFVRVPPLGSDGPCVGTRVCPALENLPMVRLTGAEVHARALDAENGLDGDVILPLEFEGYSLVADPLADGGVLNVSDYYPFQYQFEAEGRPFFRPSWSPDGDALVVSDGLRLLRWTPGDLEVDSIAGTDDGISPAWSPTGDWIAFTRHPRTDSITFTCEYQNVYLPNPEPVTDCVEQRTLYVTSAPEVVLVRPDGSELRVLGTGVDPAWAPDGTYVYAGNWSGSGMIGRVSVTDGRSELIDGTGRGIEPAVSPDGTRLVFARAAFAPPGTHDLWVVELP